MKKSIQLLKSKIPAPESLLKNYLKFLITSPVILKEAPVEKKELDWDSSCAMS